LSRTRALGAGIAVLAAAAAAPAAGAAAAPRAATPRALLDAARLQGFYGVSGVVTKAVGVPGEHRGERVSRTWAFNPPPSCSSGQCATIELVRTRASGVDELLLTRRGPALYSGAGAFLAPVRCHGRLYRKGQLATFTITVRITAAEAQGSAVQATGFAATYTGAARTGLTRCVNTPSHDSARYVGAPAAGATRRVASTRSSTAS
jgi:hypothetical protein